MHTENFHPSRNRSVLATAATGASQIQPTGRALPTLVAGGPSTVDIHIAAASAINPTTALLTTTLSEQCREIINETLRLPDAVIPKRASAFSTLQAVSNSFTQHRNAWTPAIPPDSPAQNINFPLICAITNTFGYADTTHVADLALGMSITGHIPPTGTLPLREKAAATPYATWAAGIPMRNAEIIQRIRADQGSTLSNACWELCLKEVQDGWLTAPIPLGDTIAASTQLTPRFAKSEQHGAEPAKIRLLDDFKAPGINEMLDTLETSIPDCIDVFLAHATFAKSILPECTLLAASVDFKHAYKHIGISADQQHLATLLIAPPFGPLVTTKLRTQPFGSARAPANWCRVTNFVKWHLALLFRINLSVYVDDCFVVEPAATIQSAFDTILSVCALLGLKLEPTKASPPNNQILLLVAQIAISHDHMTAALPLRKQNEWPGELKKMLERITLSPAQAAKIRGMLGFAQALMFGRFGRAHLTAFPNRQYAVSCRNMLNAELRDVTPWWLNAISNSIPRRVQFRPQKPILVYTDAAGSGHIGAVLVDGPMRTTVHTHLPHWLLRGDISIFEKEGAGILLGVLLAQLVDRSRPITICCDNIGANGAIIRGSCRTIIGRALVSCIWTLAAPNHTLLWVEYVRSKLNPADPPSRCCPLCETPTKLEGPFRGIPAMFNRILKSKNDLLKYQNEASAVSNEYVDSWPCPCPPPQTPASQ